MKRLHRREKGFTLIELLIVVAILGILAAVIVPNLAGFLKTGKVAAANTEVANVESAALAYYADHDGQFPGDTNTDLVGGGYLNDTANQDYGFDDYGKVVLADGTDWDGSGACHWVVADHEYVRS